MYKTLNVLCGIHLLDCVIAQGLLSVCVLQDPGQAGLQADREALLQPCQEHLCPSAQVSQGLKPYSVACGVSGDLLSLGCGMCLMMFCWWLM